MDYSLSPELEEELKEQGIKNPVFLVERDDEQFQEVLRTYLFHEEYGNRN